jgi:hypothetical protein
MAALPKEFRPTRAEKRNEMKVIDKIKSITWQNWSIHPDAPHNATLAEQILWGCEPNSREEMEAFVAEIEDTLR